MKRARGDWKEGHAVWENEENGTRKRQGNGTKPGRRDVVEKEFLQVLLRQSWPKIKNPLAINADPVMDFIDSALGESATPDRSVWDW